MCRFHGLNCGCADRLRSLYRQERRRGRPSDSAYVVALGLFQQLHPEADAFAAMGALKDALAPELEVGLIDCGEPVALMRLL